MLIRSMGAGFVAGRVVSLDDGVPVPGEPK